MFIFNFYLNIYLNSNSINLSISTLVLLFSKAVLFVIEIRKVMAWSLSHPVSEKSETRLGK